jgi:hypothetical protein
MNWQVSEPDGCTGQSAGRVLVHVETDHAAAVSDGGLSMEAAEEANRAGVSRRANQWAELMPFGLDVLACARCGVRLRLMALIDEASVVQLWSPSVISMGQRRCKCRRRRYGRRQHSSAT